MDYLTKGDDVVNNDEHQLNRYAGDIHQMLSKAKPEVIEQILKIHDQIFFITSEHASVNKIIKS
jgi:hypothetical protein